MDFASLMSREIAKEIPAASKNTSSAYLKKAEVEKQREEAYRNEQAKLQQIRDNKAQRKRQIEEDEAARKTERDEKRRRLAEESRHLREEEEAKKERARRKRLGLPEATIQQEVEKKEDYEEAKVPDSQKDLPIPTTLLLLPESDLRVPATPPTKADLPYLYRQLVSYFTLLLEAWRDALAARPTAVAASTAGKAALTAYTSSVMHLRPLFVQFERGTLEPHLLAAVLEIVSAAQDRRYVDANDAYLRLSIGKAAWPIGVTMVGIHERSAREKLSEHGQARTDGVAHIMSDEGTRKWLQSLKRCLSFAQTRWPPEDIGQMMG